MNAINARLTNKNARVHLFARSCIFPLPPRRGLLRLFWWKDPRWARLSRHGYVLTPRRYVGVAPEEDDGEPFEEKMRRLVAQLREQQAEARRLDEAIGRNLKELGYGG